MVKGFSRRAQRKEDRLVKKQKKNAFFQQRMGQASSNDAVSKNNTIEDGSDRASGEKKKRKRKKKTNDESLKITKIDQKREQRFIREEEKAIKKYEKLLKLKSYTKRSKIPKSFYFDGLGELLEICDNKKYNNRLNTDDCEDEFAVLRNRPKKQIVEKKVEVDSLVVDSDTDDGGDNEGESNEEMDASSDSDHGETGEDEDQNEDANFSNDMEDGSDLDGIDAIDDLEEAQEPIKPRKMLKKDAFREDIYGFIRDKDGNIVKNEKKRQTKENILNCIVVVDEALQRKLRGLLNRLTADNIKVIAREILDLYKGNSRAVINKGILNCFEKVIIHIEYSVPAKLVSEMAMLVAILHSEMGDEVGGFFIHTAIRHFDRLFGDETLSDSSKRLNNIVVLILNLYSTGLVDSAIVYDILDKFCEQFSKEKSIEIIDLILKTSGFLLRKDDATRMKSLIVKIQQLSCSVDQEGLSGTRIKFILESLTAIKNNNVAKLKVTDPVVMGELIESTLKGVLKKGRVPFIAGQYATVIQSAHWFSYTATIIPLEAINAKENETIADAVVGVTSTGLADDPHPKIDFRLRDQICRRLRINTPLRRDLFTVLFACNDYLEAACKLISICKKQFSEVIHVVLHVAVNEKVYNPFYYYLLEHLSTCDRKYKLALDFAARDKIGQVETMSPAHRNTFAKLLFNMLKSNIIAITCLKVIQFSDMNEVYVDFIRQILEPLFSQCDDATIENVLAKIPKKDSFASAFKLFISCFLSAETKNKMTSVKQLQFKLKI